MKAQNGQASLKISDIILGIIPKFFNVVILIMQCSITLFIYRTIQKELQYSSLLLSNFLNPNFGLMKGRFSEKRGNNLMNVL